MTKRKPPDQHKPAGRPWSLTREQLSEVVGNMTAGAFPLSAALAAGISRSAHFRMLEASRSGDETIPQVILDYGTAVEKATGSYALDMYRTIKEAAKGYERVARWGSGDPILIDGQDNVISQLAVKNGATGRVLMEHIPGQWTAAARINESLMPTEFMRTVRPIEIGADGQPVEEAGALFDIVEVPSDRAAAEIVKLEDEVRKRQAKTG